VDEFITYGHIDEAMVKVASDRGKMLISINERRLKDVVSQGVDEIREIIFDQ
jgi:hypothetical protein